MILIDTNVILDVLTVDGIWFDWSAAQLSQSRQSGSLYINEVSYAELAVGVETQTGLDAALNELAIGLERMPTEALFAAAKAFLRYRTAGGPCSTILPDFFIGAHAEISGRSLLTRDPRRFRSYFPSVRLFTPQSRIV